MIRKDRSAVSSASVLCRSRRVIANDIFFFPLSELKWKYNLCLLFSNKINLKVSYKANDLSSFSE